MVEILFKNKDVVIISKKAGVGSQSDLSGDKDALTYTKEILLDMGERADLWLVHRLDRVVGGLLVFARNKDSAAKLSAIISEEKLEKGYLAVVEGSVCSGTLSDYLFKDARLSKAFVVKSERKGAKYAELEYEALAEYSGEKGVYTLVSVKLKTGRFHQIRAQFASRGTPLVGDGKYGSRDNRAKMPALFSNAISFNLGKEKIEANKLPDTSVYPWSLFSSIIDSLND